MLFIRPQLMYSPDGDSGATPSQPAANDSDLAERLMSAFSNLSQKQGGQDAAGVLLLQENKEYRDKIKDLERQLKDAQGKAPADGSTILTPEQTAVWAAYQELGKPDDLKVQRDEYSQMKRETVYRQLAEAHGLNYDAVRQLPGIDGLEFEETEVEKDGEKHRVFSAKNGDGQVRPFADVIDEKWAVFKPALVKEAESQQSRYTPVTRQVPGGKPVKEDAIGAALDKKYQKRQTITAQEK